MLLNREIDEESGLEGAKAKVKGKKEETIRNIIILIVINVLLSDFFIEKMDVALRNYYSEILHFFLEISDNDARSFPTHLGRLRTTVNN